VTLDEALAQAARENALDDGYVDCVRPLLRDGPERWPRCCGGSCEPCSEVLIRVATRTLQLTAPAPAATGG
jgi:hypothetical protein